MSDNNTTDADKKSERSGLSGWLGGLVALITAIGGLAALVQSLHSAGLIGFKPDIASSPSPFAESQPLAGSQDQPNSNQIPNGTYKSTCEYISVRGDVLYATCARLDGQWNNTYLENFKDCKGVIENIDGSLRCIE